ncbi:MAG: putative ABC transporter permease [Ruminococcaceae bacterium]|nr:putative ABC transporter permease [Oscillospiraceae bacterium]
MREPHENRETPELQPAEGAPAPAAQGNAAGPATAAGRDAVRAQKRARFRLWKHKDVNAGRESFAAGLNIYKMIWIFILGCVIGVVFETLFVFFEDGEWMRRSGVLYGPFNQIYGMGAVLMTLVLYRYRKKNALIIFVVSAVLGGAFEYVCSWVQQLAFGSVSWEYSDMPTSIGGRTNLFYTFGWGLMGFIFIVHIWPYLSEMVERIPNRFKIRPFNKPILGKTFTIVLAVALALDLALTGLAVFRYGTRAEERPATNFIDRWMDDWYPDEVMAEKFPSMEFVGRTNLNNAQLTENREDVSGGFRQRLGGQADDAGAPADESDATAGSSNG